MPKIYTRSGDDGSTSLANGQRLRKDCVRVSALGAVDELNALLGVIMACDASASTILEPIQHQLFELGAEIANPGSSRISASHVEQIEQSIDQLEAELPQLKAFILPGGSLATSHAHQARAVCRRAERKLLRLSREEQVNLHSIKFLNRLSDLLFVVARTLAHEDNNEVTWLPETD